MSEDDEHGHAPEVFPFRFDPLLAPLAVLVGVTPFSAYVAVNGDRLDARFGPWRVVTGLANLRAAALTGSFRPWKVAGPPHLSLADRGLTFGTSTGRGVCLTFRQPVPGLEPTGRLLHPALTVTVDDAEGLVALLRQRCGPDLELPGDTRRDELAGLTARELRALARQHGVDGASALKKGELVDVLSAIGPAAADAEG